MSTKLTKIIRYHEAERDSLTAQLNECLAESEYAFANRLSKGLRLVNNQLRILYNLRDGQHDEKERAAKRIKWLEEKSEEEPGRVREYYVERIAEERKKLAALEALSQLNRPKSTALPEALTKLFEKQIAAFTLVFSLEERLAFTFKLLLKTLMITLPEVKRTRGDYALRKQQIRFLLNLGFRRYDRGDKLILFLPFSVPAEIAPVKSILAQITFDLFCFKEFAQNNFIKYDEPAAN